MPVISFNKDNLEPWEPFILDPRIPLQQGELNHTDKSSNNV